MFGRGREVDSLQRSKPRIGTFVALWMAIALALNGTAQEAATNETFILRMLHHLVWAEKQYFSTHQEQYTTYIINTNPRQNSLLDSAARGSLMSPDRLPGEQGTNPDHGLILYRGYYYRVLTGQGRSAPGGAKTYIVNGRMTAGFAFVAFPVDYRTTSASTFIVSEDGVVYQKDLGENTGRLAASMKEFDPDPSWQRSQEPPAADPSEPEHGQWQVGTVTAAAVHQPGNGDPLITSYEVSVQVGSMVFTVLCTPRYDTGTVLFESGRQFNVLIGDDTITYYDLLGNPVRDPILKRMPAPASSF